MFVVFGVYIVAVITLGDTCVSVCLLPVGCTLWRLLPWGIPVCLCACCLWGVHCGGYCLGGYPCVCVLIAFGVYSVAATALATTRSVMCVCVCQRFCSDRAKSPKNIRQPKGRVHQQPTLEARAEQLPGSCRLTQRTDTVRNTAFGVECRLGNEGRASARQL